MTQKEIKISLDKLLTDLDFMVLFKKTPSSKPVSIQMLRRTFTEEYKEFLYFDRVRFVTMKDY